MWPKFIMCISNTHKMWPSDREIACVSCTPPKFTANQSVQKKGRSPHQHTTENRNPPSTQDPERTPATLNKRITRTNAIEKSLWKYGY